MQNIPSVIDTVRVGGLGVGSNKNLGLALGLATVNYCVRTAIWLGTYFANPNHSHARFRTAAAASVITVLCVLVNKAQRNILGKINWPRRRANQKSAQQAQICRRLAEEIKQGLPGSEEKSWGKTLEQYKNDPKWSSRIEIETERMSQCAKRNLKVWLATAILISTPIQAVTAFYLFKPVMKKFGAIPTETKPAAKTPLPVAIIQL